MATPEDCALIEDLVAALMWCGGSGDFGPGGQAEQGWQRVVVPLFERAAPYISDELPEATP